MQIYTYFSKPRNASASMTLILFSYKVNISSVSSPSNARLWICEMRLWFKFNINKWWRFLIASDGTFCSWFCETSNCVSSLPEKKKKHHNVLLSSDVNDNMNKNENKKSEWEWEWECSVYVNHFDVNVSHQMNFYHIVCVIVDTWKRRKKKLHRNVDSCFMSNKMWHKWEAIIFAVTLHENQLDGGFIVYSGSSKWICH